MKVYLIASSVLMLNISLNAQQINKREHDIICGSGNNTFKARAYCWDVYNGVTFLRTECEPDGQVCNMPDRRIVEINNQPKANSPNNPPNPITKAAPKIFPSTSGTITLRSVKNFWRNGVPGIAFYPSIIINNGVGYDLSFMVYLQYKRTHDDDTQLKYYHKNFKFICSSNYENISNSYFFIPYSDLSGIWAFQYQLQSRIDLLVNTGQMTGTNWTEYETLNVETQKKVIHHDGTKFGVH